jgi:nitrite reductase/ring-hydroxylating ferredoxin subunit
VKGEQIALFNVDSQFFALGNTCTHRGGLSPMERCRGTK